MEAEVCVEGPGVVAVVAGAAAGEAAAFADAVVVAPGQCEHRVLRDVEIDPDGHGALKRRQVTSRIDVVELEEEAVAAEDRVLKAQAIRAHVGAASPNPESVPATIAAA